MTKTNIEKSSSYAEHFFISVGLTYSKDVWSIWSFYQTFAAKCRSAETCNVY